MIGGYGLDFMRVDLEGYLSEGEIEDVMLIFLNISFKLEDVEVCIDDDDCFFIFLFFFMLLFFFVEEEVLQFLIVFLIFIFEQQQVLYYV